MVFHGINLKNLVIVAIFSHLLLMICLIAELSVENVVTQTILVVDLHGCRRVSLDISWVRFKVSLTRVTG